MIIFTENQNEDTQKVNKEITLQELLYTLSKKKATVVALIIYHSYF